MYINIDIYINININTRRRVRRLRTAYFHGYMQGMCAKRIASNAPPPPPPGLALPVDVPPASGELEVPPDADDDMPPLLSGTKSGTGLTGMKLDTVNLVSLAHYPYEMTCKQLAFTRLGWVNMVSTRYHSYAKAATRLDTVNRMSLAFYPYVMTRRKLASIRPGSVSMVSNNLDAD